MHTAWAYLRRSVGRDDEGSIATSRDDVRRLASRLGADLADNRIYLDDDVSGSKVRGDTTAWLRLVRDLQADPPDYLLAAKYDRLGRRLADLETLDDLSRAKGFKVWTVADGDLFKTAHWPMLAAMAKVEASNTRERVLRAQERRRASGHMSAGAGNRPYGYTSNGLEIVPKEAEIIRDIARRLIDGHSLIKIAEWLNTNHGDRLWRPNGVSRMLKNPRLAGLLSHRGCVVGKAAWIGILTPEEYNEVVSVLSRNRPGRMEVSLLAGVTRCQVPLDSGRCDARMTSDKDKAGHYVYRCKKSQGGCSRLSRRRSDIDAYVLKRLFARLDAMDGDREWNQIDLATRDNSNALAEVDLDLYELRQKYATGEIVAADFYPLLDGLRKRRRSLEVASKTLDERRLAAKRTGTAQHHWGTLDLVQQRRVIKDHISAVLLYPHGRSGRPAREIRDGEVEILWADSGQIATDGVPLPDDGLRRN